MLEIFGKHKFVVSAGVDLGVIRSNPFFFFQFTLGLCKTFPKNPDNGVSDIPNFKIFPPRILCLRRSQIRTSGNKTLDPRTRSVHSTARLAGAKGESLLSLLGYRTPSSLVIFHNANGINNRILFSFPKSRAGVLEARLG